MEYGGGRKRGRFDAPSFNGNGGFKKSKPHSASGSLSFTLSGFKFHALGFSVTCAKCKLKFYYYFFYFIVLAIEDRKICCNIALVKLSPNYVYGILDFKQSNHNLVSFGVCFIVYLSYLKFLLWRI